uniref:Uncharacterized protein n=1 Tax=Timema shepardi TaxID=629360 RepID=A0A7R9G048_TIMSH|nr:unnamed protein product [Timema shepardi]
MCIKLTQGQMPADIVYSFHKNRIVYNGDSTWINSGSRSREERIKSIAPSQDAAIPCASGGRQKKLVTSVNQYRYYGGGDDQRGREEGLFAAPNKRRVGAIRVLSWEGGYWRNSGPVWGGTFKLLAQFGSELRELAQFGGSSSFRPMVPHALPATQQGVARLKRDLELDPEDVLALLSLWEAQHHNNYPYRAPATNWPQYNGYESPDDFDTPEDDGNTEDEEESPNGNWLEGPVYPSSATTYPGGHYSLEKRPSYYYPSYPVQKREGQWGTFPKDKRFMVSRKRQVGDRLTLDYPGN